MPDESLRDQLNRIEDAWYDVRPVSEVIAASDSWVVDVYDDYLIVNTGSEYYQVPYSESEGEIEFADQSDWLNVEKQVEWVAKSVQAQIKHVGRNPLKTLSVDDESIRVANYMILFGDEKSKDLDGEYFTAETDIESEYTKSGRLYVDWEHRYDKKGPGDAIMGVIDWATKKADEIGIWVERTLDRRNAYVQAIEPLLEKGIIGTSSESIPGKTEVLKNGQITKWPLRRDSLTVMPAEPRMMTDNVLAALKSINSLEEAQPEEPQVETPEDAMDASAATKHDGEPNQVISKITPQEKSTMKTKEEVYKNFAKVMGIDVGDLTDEQKTLALHGHDFEEPATEDNSELEKQVKTLSGQVEELLRYAQEQPGIKSAGYISEDGGDDKKVQKSFGDFLVAVARKDERRLKNIYGSYKTAKADMGEGSGAVGGYLVPEEYETSLLQMANESSRLREMVTVVPVTSPRGNWPSLDQFTAPTAGVGDTAFAGGLTAARTAENAALTETNPAFEQIKWNIEKVGGYTQASNELINDSPMSIETMLSALFAVAIAAKREHYIFRGTGAGEPLGILNAGCAIGVSPDANNVWDEGDALEMMSRFKSYLTRGSWFIHPGIIPDLGEFEMGSGGSVFVSDPNNDPVIGQPLFGKPVYQSEHLPQDDNAGCVVLADMKAYLLFEKPGLEIAFSEHYGFINDQGTWRFYQRLDGQPWLSAAITLADPNGSFTVSPFVYFND